MAHRFSAWAASALLAFLCGGAAAASRTPQTATASTSAQPTAAADHDRWWHGYLTRAHHVRLPDGRHLTVFCEGQGTPVVVLDIGLGGGAWGWSTVQDTMARQTRVCSYDRSGYSDSDPATGVRSVDALAGDLDALLTAARIPAPYVLVGQSIGGAIVGVFAQAHPTRVAGLVLVDPSSGHQTQRVAAIDPSFDDEAARLAAARKCVASADRGTLMPGSEDETTCVHDAERIGVPSFAAQTFSRWAHGSTLRAKLAEMEGIDLGALHWPQGAHTAAPVLVLTSTETFTQSTKARALQAAWKSMHDQIAQTSAHGLNCVVPHATHSMMFSQPEAVIGAVAQMVNVVRARDPGALHCNF